MISLLKCWELPPRAIFLNNENKSVKKKQQPSDLGEEIYSI